jgi:hypothetical protein
VPYITEALVQFLHEEIVPGLPEMVSASFKENGG